MRYLRMLTNSVLGAALGAVNLTVLFYGFIVVRELLATRPLGPGWISVRVLAWMTALTAGGASFLMWSNLRGFETVLDADPARRLLPRPPAPTPSPLPPPPT